MKIGYVARFDFLSKPGGDTVQWRTYEAAARKAGFSCVAWFDDEPVPEADVYHVLNVDRPLEVYPKMRRVERLGKPFILSTIHHSNLWLQRMREAEPPGGLLGRMLYLSPMGRSLPVAESIKEVVRLAKDGRLAHISDLWPTWTRRVQWMLKHAQCVTLLARAERDVIEEDFGVQIPDIRLRVIPNWIDGIDDAFCQPSYREMGFNEPPVLVVGRIETRKNVRRIAALAAEVGREVLFVGKPNPNEPAYLNAFEREVEKSEGIRWIPGVPRENLGELYRSAAFLMNASYVEVSPLVDIEALAFGCPVATTRYAVHHEWLPKGTPQIDAHDDKSILETLQWRPERIEPFEAVNKEVYQDALIDLYRALTN